MFFWIHFNFVSIYGYLLCARLGASISDARVNMTDSVDCSIMCVTGRCRPITFVLASPSISKNTNGHKLCILLQILLL